MDSPMHRARQWAGRIHVGEVLSGVALRVPACRLGDRGFVSYDVRRLSTERQAEGTRIVVEGEGAQGARAIFRARHEILPPAGGARPWVEDEYAVILPEQVDAISVRCVRASDGKVLASCEVDPSRRRRLLDRYYGALRNPFADPSYPRWRKDHAATEEELARQRSAELARTPLISLVTPVYRTPPRYLAAMLDSVLAQTYPRWELVVVNASPDDDGVSQVLASCDDPRIRVVDHPENDGINGNTNAGIAACEGDYVGFIDHDDFLEPDALFEYASEMGRHPDADILYCDEDSFEEPGTYLLPLFKPDFDRDLLYSNNYVVHMEMVSREILEKTGRSPAETNGAQDYDLMLKGMEHARRISHIPRVLYHWRKHEGSTNAGNTDSKPYAETAGETVLRNHFARLGIPIAVREEPVSFTYRVLPRAEHRRSVSVIVDDDPDPSHLEELCQRLSGPSVEIVPCGQANSATAGRNEAAERARGELLLFLATDAMPLSDDILGVLASYFERPEVGLVGPRLMYPDGQQQSSGLVIRSDGGLTSMGQDLPAWDGGYNGRAHRPCNWSAVSHAAQMVRREDFLALGGYATCYESIEYASADLCLGYRQRGMTVTYTPFAEMRHSEPSQTPYAPPTTDAVARGKDDRRTLHERWPETNGWSDPLYNRNLDERSPYFRLRDR